MLQNLINVHKTENVATRIWGRALSDRLKNVWKLDMRNPPGYPISVWMSGYWWNWSWLFAGEQRQQQQINALGTHISPAPSVSHTSCIGPSANLGPGPTWILGKTINLNNHKKYHPQKNMSSMVSRILGYHHSTYLSMPPSTVTTRICRYIYIYLYVYCKVKNKHTRSHDTSHKITWNSYEPIL